MPVTPDRPAPYAPATVITGLVERHRSRGLPSPIDADVLARAGVSLSLIPRTMQALQALDLINEDNRPTDVLEGMRLAPEAEYRSKMAEWLQGAYADALQYVDPANDDEAAIRDAFRKYNPVGQQSRMVTLFTGLFRAAGIRADKAAAPPRRQSNGVSVSRPPAPQRKRKEAPPPARHGDHAPHAHRTGGLPPALSGLLASLPDPEIGWTKADRDRFLATFEAVLDFCFPASLKAEHATAAAQDDPDDAAVA